MFPNLFGIITNLCHFPLFDVEIRTFETQQHRNLPERNILSNEVDKTKRIYYDSKHAGVEEQMVARTNPSEYIGFRRAGQITH